MLSDLKINNPVPKFLMAENTQEKPDLVYVVHTQTPMFVLANNIHDFEEEPIVYWLDQKPDDNAHIEELVEEAIEFINLEYEHQEAMYGSD